MVVVLADIAQCARAEGRICITLDANFHSLLAISGECGPSVIRIRKQGLDANALAALLQPIWPGIGGGLGAGAMVTATDRAVRVRRLPVVRG
jgi:predicted nuclease of predicted toxin-antitoxin system